MFWEHTPLVSLSFEDVLYEGVSWLHWKCPSVLPVSMFSNIRSFLHSCDLKPSKRTFCNSQAFSALDFLRGRISILPCPFTAFAAGSRSLCGQSPQPQEVPGTSAGDMLLTHTFLAHSLDLDGSRSFQILGLMFEKVYSSCWSRQLWASFARPSPWA